jgi:inhibitor of cysteine peptidase
VAVRRAVVLGFVLAVAGPAVCGDAIAVRAGARFTVTLDANATTGFRWRLAQPLDVRVVRLVGSEYRGPDISLTGAGGAEVWTFEAVAPGRTTIAFAYVRPWERDVQPARARAVRVKVEPPSRPRTAVP